MSLNDVILSPDLIKTLVELYPQRCIREGEPYEEHLRYAGAAGLVERLRQIYNSRGEGTFDLVLGVRS
jgi:hypothetical protein